MELPGGRNTVTVPVFAPSRASGPVPLLALLFLVCGSSLFAEISGTVTNATTGKPQAGVVVTLVHPGENGMQTLGTAKTDADGNFKIDQPVPPPPALLEAVYQNVQYNQVLPPNAPPTGVRLSVFNSTGQLPETALKQEHAVVLEPGADGIRVDETFLIGNSGNTTLLDPVKGSVQFFLPKAIQGSTKVSIQAPGGMPINRAPEKTAQTDVFKVSYPIKPGETDYEVAYTLPPSKTFAGKLLGKSPLILVTPEAVQLSGAGVKEDGIKQLGQDGPNARVYELSAASGASYEVSIEGTGTLQAAETAQQGEDDGSPKPTAGNARLYQRLPWVLGLTFWILGLGGALLYRRSRRLELAALEVEGRLEILWRLPGPARHRLQCDARLDRGAAGAQRRGQNHAAAHHRGIIETVARIGDAFMGPTCARKQRPARIGVLGHGISLYDELSAIENLRAVCKVLRRSRSAKRLDEMLERTGLSGFATDWCASSRAGCGSVWPWRACFCTIRKCCCWTSRSPRSTTAPSRCCKRCSEDTHARGRTIVMSTHQLREALEVATHVAMIQRGQIVHAGERRQEMLDDTGWLYRTYGEN